MVSKLRQREVFEVLEVVKDEEEKDPEASRECAHVEMIE